jgi:hypothetical protein
MRRLNETELDARIHNFLERKFAEFPQLDPEIEPKTPAKIRTGRQSHSRPLNPRMRWGTAL